MDAARSCPGLRGHGFARAGGKNKQRRQPMPNGSEDGGRMQGMAPSHRRLGRL